MEPETETQLTFITGIACFIGFYIIAEFLFILNPVGIGYIVFVICKFFKVEMQDFFICILAYNIKIISQFSLSLDIGRGQCLFDTLNSRTSIH